MLQRDDYISFPTKLYYNLTDCSTPVAHEYLAPQKNQIILNGMKNIDFKSHFFLCH